MHVCAESIGDAWRDLLEAIYESDQTVRDEGMELRELVNVLVTIEAPIPPAEEDAFLRRNADDELVQWMHDNFHSMVPVEGWGYSYGSRLYDFEGVDQIEHVKEKLSADPEAKSATVSAMYPPGDSSHVPCICSLDFKVRDGLILTAFFRSQDVGRKFAPDLLALQTVFEDVATHLGVARTRMVVHVASAHIYERDYDRVEEMLTADGRGGDTRRPTNSGDITG